MLVQSTASPSAAPAAWAAGLEGLAARVENAAYWVAEVARGHPSEAIGDPLNGSVDILRTVWSALRILAMVLDRTYLDMIVQSQDDIQAAVGKVGGAIASLHAAGERARSTIREQLGELDGVVRLEGSAEAPERLRTIAGTLLRAATEMREELGRSSSEIAGGERIRRAVEERAAQVRQRALCRSLPRVLARDTLGERMEELVSGTSRFRRNVCLGIVEVDQLGAIAEEHGGLVADALLLRVAQVVQQEADSHRGAEIGFYGRDRLAIILPSCSLGKGHQLMVRLASAVRHSRWECEAGGRQATLSPTISVGLTQPCKGEGVEDFRQRAESRLHEARERGGDTVAAAR